MGMVKTGNAKMTYPANMDTEFATHRMDVVRFLMIFMVLLTVVSIFHVWSRFHLVELNLKIIGSSKQLKDLEQQQKQLKLEVESLKTPARIETIAKQELGMSVPQDEQIILVK